MKPGDLVTLSSYADGLQNLWKWCSWTRQNYQEKGPLIGIVIKVDAATCGAWSSRGTIDRKFDRYRVKWMEPNGPDGRDGTHGGVFFFRKDLKFISKA